MGGLFGSTPKFKAPPVIEAPPPVVEDAAAKAEQDTEALRRKRGRAASVLTGNNEETNPNTATRALTGS